jgi:hypothetical protein
MGALNVLGKCLFVLSPVKVGTGTLRGYATNHGVRSDLRDTHDAYGVATPSSDAIRSSC